MHVSQTNHAKTAPLAADEIIVVQTGGSPTKTISNVPINKPTGTPTIIVVSALVFKNAAANSVIGRVTRSVGLIMIAHGRVNTASKTMTWVNFFQNKHYVFIWKYIKSSNE